MSTDVVDMSTDAVETSPPPTRPWPDALRLLAFVLSVMVLFLAARQGQSQPVMYAAFAAFLVAATLWVRGLDDNWIEGREDFRNWWVSAGVVAVSALGTAVVAAKADDSRSTYVLGALIAFYVLLGLAIRQLRWWVIDDPGAADQPWWEQSGRWLLARMLHWQVLAVLVGAAYAGFWLLGSALMPLALVLLAAVVAVPAVVQVLSEQRILALSAASQDDQRRLWILGGMLMLATGLAIAAWVAFHQTLYAVAIVLAVAALAWALTVGSLADVAAVLAVLALMGVTPGSQEVPPAILKAPAPGAAPQKVVVALGDSYSSGEGAERYLEKSNVAGGNQCRRAATAWPVLVAQAMGADRLVFRACSGARARNLVGVVDDDEQYPGEGIQVDRALRDLGTDAAKRPPALVLLSIGGNDAGFRQIGSSCLSMHSCNDAELSSLFYDNLPDVESALRATYAAVATKFPASPIAVMPYPDAFATEDGCVRAPVEKGDIRFVRAFTDKLDDIIEKVAKETGLYYVAPMRSALTQSRLGLCDPSGTPGLNFLDFRGVGGAALNRFNPGNWIHNSLHPNERGHAALAAAFTGWLSERRRVEGDETLTGLAALLPATANRPRRADGSGGGSVVPAALPVPTKTTSTLCFEKASGGCGPKADAWALRQLGPGTVPVFLLAAWTALGAWFLAVGFSALRFRRRSP